MPVPSPRNKILPVRGNKATLQSNLASLADGEICYALDENSFYVKESGALVEARGASAKAWVNFNGTGTVAIRASYNVSSITDNGTGNYVVNFTTAMPDADYTFTGAVSNTIDDWTTEYSGPTRGPTGLEQDGTTAPTSSALSIETRYGSSGTSNGAVADLSAISVAIFR